MRRNDCIDFDNDDCKFKQQDRTTQVYAIRRRQREEQLSQISSMRILMGGKCNGAECNRTLANPSEKLLGDSPMKMTFSQRQGVEAAPQVLRLSEMPMTLRNALWNVFDVHLWQSNDFVYFRATGQPGYVVQVSALLWDEFFHWPLDQRRMHRGSLDADGIRNVVRRYFFEAPWNKVYEFFEFLLGYRFSHDLLARRLGEVLEREMAPCRIINAEFVEITNELEIEMLNTAIEGGQFAAPAEHLKTALRNL